MQICKPSIFIHYLTICYCWFVVKLLYYDVTKNRKEVKTIKFFPVPDTDLVTPFKAESMSMSLSTPLSCPIGAKTRRDSVFIGEPDGGLNALNSNMLNLSCPNRFLLCQIYHKFHDYVNQQN